MKKIISLLLAGAMLLSASACSSNGTSNDTISDISPDSKNSVCITANSDGTFDLEAPEKKAEAVEFANDIIYYEDGKDFTYGEGTEADEHNVDEAAMHTVIHIKEPGTYVLTGTVPMGQVAVDLGDEAESDPEAVVNLVLDNFDITCTVAPAIIFYNVYECGDPDDPQSEVDTSAAGANVLITDGSINNVRGSYVAKIYKEYTLSNDGTEVVDSKKLHKYDGAFYSKMSMNIFGETENSGVLNIEAENEGLDSEMHLTINGGNIKIESGNDGINTNEDGISVTTVNGGSLDIVCNGSTGEGDGIDSNGWLVINGGSVKAQACAVSGDAGIDSDMGIHINGGTVVATGNMLDRISESKATFAVFEFGNKASGDFVLRDSQDKDVMSISAGNDFNYMILAAPELTAGDYSLWQGETRYIHLGKSGNIGMGGMEPPEGMEMPDGMEMPEGMEPPEGFGTGAKTENPDPNKMPPAGSFEPGTGAETPEGFEIPEEFKNIDPSKFNPAGAEGFEGGRPDTGSAQSPAAEPSHIFSITEGENYFMSVDTEE